MKTKFNYLTLILFVLLGQTFNLAQAYDVIGTGDCKVEERSAHQADEIHILSMSYSVVLYYTASFEAKTCENGRTGKLKQKVSGSFDTGEAEFDWAHIGPDQWKSAKQDALARCELLRQNFLDIHASLNKTACAPKKWAARESSPNKTNF
jgi:hypothetical protein